jgi:hypothetical protein
MQLPDYNFLSAPLWLITVLHILTLTLHFVAMNFLVGGIIAVLWGKFTNRWDDPTVRVFVKYFPTATAATVTLGVAPLLFVQLVYHRQIYSASIVSGWFWLMITLVLTISYYFLYGASLTDKKDACTGRKLLFALVGLIYVSLVYSSVFSMAESPATIRNLYAGDQSGLSWNTDVMDYALRWLHMMLGAITVGGFFVGWIGQNNPQAFKIGRSFFLIGWVLAALVGFGYLFALGDFLRPFMRSPGIWVLTIGILLSAGGLHFFTKRKFVPSALMLFVSLLMMVASRHYVRLVKLDCVVDPSAMPVRIQWSPFILFLVCFVIALGTVWYMLRLFKAGKSARA